jgi:cysteinyl-tRNA synthetase
MLTLFNSLGKKLEPFEPENENTVNIFTCGPSVYQRAHIGNFRTFLFEDVLVRYLEYSGYRVKRGMNFTDVEDKAIGEAESKKISPKDLTDQNIKDFIDEMNLLKMKVPDYLSKASEAVDETVEIIEQLLRLGTAYWHDGNIYFDPSKFPRFGELYGLDMTRWPSKRKRFHRDTYPGMRWNLGDFILWHGEKRSGSLHWETRIGKGRPSWNIQDPGIIYKLFDETLSIYCGGIDNLIRHHDYIRAILESIRTYPMAKYWLHCYHLVVGGRKMSKSRGNIYYTDKVLNEGYSIEELRFFLIYGQYRKELNYSKKAMNSAAEKLRKFKKTVRTFGDIGGRATDVDEGGVQEIREIFAGSMDQDLNVKEAFDKADEFLSKTDVGDLNPSAASGYLKGLREIDEVLGVIF